MNDELRRQLLELLDGHGAQLPFDAAVADLPADRIDDRARNVAVKPWHLLEHLRLAQRDILDHVRDRGCLEPSWLEEDWPAILRQVTTSWPSDGEP